MSDWRPIETAPKDGTWFLAYVPENAGRYAWGGYELCSRQHQYECVLPASGWAPVCEGYWAGTDTSEPIEPTHWMPLPAPPDDVRAE